MARNPSAKPGVNAEVWYRVPSQLDLWPTAREQSKEPFSNGSSARWRSAKYRLQFCHATGGELEQIQFLLGHAHALRV